MITKSPVEAVDGLREVGYRQWEGYPDLWIHPNGEGIYLTEEALFREWRLALARAGRADAKHEECWNTLVTMAVGTSLILVLLTAIIVLHA